MTTVGQIETCHACRLSFSLLPGESTSGLIHRYADWREAHGGCAVGAQPSPSGSETDWDAEQAVF